jgi:hypothetical protein
MIFAGHMTVESVAIKRSVRKKDMRTHYFRVNRIVGVSLGLIWSAHPAFAQPCASGIEAKEGTTQILAPTFLDAWVAKYPTSTLPDRMNLITGRSCNVCHHPPNLNSAGNCYRSDISELLQTGITIEEALDQLDAVDSDGDGVFNGLEILAARPEPGEIGYNPGLIGELGTDPCGINPGTPVSGVPETPAPAPVPTASDWGLVILGILLVTNASIMIRKRCNATTNLPNSCLHGLE